MTWSFLVDENLDPAVARILRKEGHTAEHVKNNPGRGSTDDEVLSHASQHDMVVVTNDVTDYRALSR